MAACATRSIAAARAFASSPRAPVAEAASNRASVSDRSDFPKASSSFAATGRRSGGGRAARAPGAFFVGPASSGALFVLGAHERAQEIPFAAAHPQHQCFVAAFRDGGGMTHRRIEVDALTFLQDRGIVKLRVHDDVALDDVQELLTRVADEVPELVDRLHPDT